MKAKQVPGIWLKMPPKEKELLNPVRSSARQKTPRCSRSLSNSEDGLPRHRARLKYIHEKYRVRVSIPKDKEAPITVLGNKSVNERGAIK